MIKNEKNIPLDGGHKLGISKLGISFCIQFERLALAEIFVEELDANVLRGRFAAKESSDYRNGLLPHRIHPIKGC